MARSEFNMQSLEQTFRSDALASVEAEVRVVAEPRHAALSPDRQLLLSIHRAALRAVDPMVVLPPHLPKPPVNGRTLVIGAGKAAARMAAAVEQHGAGPFEGVVVTRYGHGEPTRHIRVLEAGHPVPDTASAHAAEQMLALARTARAGDLVICLISGGGSALLSLPIDGVTAAQKAAINQALLRRGVPIDEMNCVRTHLSAIKGGKLGLACGAARVVTLVISDVPGDDPAVVASGPTIASDTTPRDALAILDRHRIETPDNVRAVLLRSASAPETATGDREVRVIATAQTMLDAAAQACMAAGVRPLVLGGSIEGEARDVAAMHAGIARQIRQHAQPLAPPCVILSGGETTVTLRGGGRGGRNAEFLLALGLAAGPLPLHAMACDTDGIDGSEDNAGAVWAPDSLTRAQALGMDAKKYLADNDGYGFFEQLDDLIVTGPSRTNVNDFRAILVR